METTRTRALRRLVLVVDGLIIVAAIFAAFWSHAALRDVVAIFKRPPEFHEYAALAYLMLPVWLSLSAILGLHRCFERVQTQREIVFDLAKLHLLGLLALALILFLTQSVINRSLVALFLLWTFASMFLARTLIGSWLHHRHESGLGRTRLLLVGMPGEAMSAFIAAASRDPLPPRFVGHLTPEPRDPGDATASPPGDLPPWRGAVADLEQILHDEAVDQVLFFPPLDQPNTVPEALQVTEMIGVPAGFAVKLEQPSRAQPRVQSVYEHPFITFDVSPKPHEKLAVKYTLDVIAAALGLVVSLPLFALASLAILVTMGRPVLFAQERAGFYGRRFRMLKFRTMRPGAVEQRDALLAANDMSGPVFKLTEDPRVTRLGRWLRRASLDELPQLLNVLIGSMSLVGPRPLPIQEQQEIRGWQRRRLSMKPGITGLWQVSGRSDVDFEEWMRLDLRYVDEWSLRLDAWILLKTIPTVLLGQGSR